MPGEEDPLEVAAAFIKHRKRANHSGNTDSQRGVWKDGGLVGRQAPCHGSSMGNLSLAEKGRGGELTRCGSEGLRG